MSQEQIRNVSESEAGSRIDRFLSAQFPEFSRSHLQKMIERSAILVNGKAVKANYRLKTGDEIRIEEDLSLVPVAIEPENIPLSILYEDEDVLIVDKPKGMVVHPAPGHYTGTLVNAILYHCGERLSGINGELRPGIVHRIDKDTTGSLIVCKNDRAHRFIADQIAVHSIRRSYVGIVAGQLKTTSGSIDAPIGRSPKDRKKMAVNVPRAKPAITHYKVLQALDGYTYLQFDLETGRTHQIRVHMASLQHPLIGDPVYGTAKGFASIQGQALHAWKIGFMHPTTRGYVEFEAPIPGYMLDFVKKHPIVSQSSRL